LLNTILKGTILLLLIWAIYRQIFVGNDADSLWRTFQSTMKGAHQGWLWAALLLVPLNWALETAKWRVFTRSFSQLRFFQSYKAVLAGVTISLFTPNRIGEYGGRILLVDARENWKSVVATLVGSYTQLLVLLSFGLVGAAYFLSRHLGWAGQPLSTLIIVGLVLLLGVLLLYYELPLVVPLLRRWMPERWMRRFYRHVVILRQYHWHTLTRALGFGAVRYGVYTIQYFMMLRFFGIEVPVDLAFSGIATIFFLQTSIPLPPLIGLVTRGEIALFIWGTFADSELLVLACTFGLFIINLLVPALIGAVFIVQTNLLKSLGYEKIMDE
ncbi:MAG: flippase-like domain-containing protein, partial [Phaeodactylibacter sp.]|nr:flippase-like domain-containing protein [Phaeodactylibacter sp.]